MSKLYVRVLPSCCGYTLCVDICPEVFQLDESGFAVAVDGPIDDQFRDRAAEACESCPQGAIESSDAAFD